MRFQNLSDVHLDNKFSYPRFKSLRVLKTMRVPVSPYSVSMINALAADDRGVIAHLKGTGNLLRKRQRFQAIYIL